MTNFETFQFIKSVFDRLTNISSVEALYEELGALDLQAEYKHFFVKYPPFNLSLTKHEIQSMRDNGVISDNNNLIFDKLQFNDPLTKLLFAVVWKNGDANKVQHIIDGISGKSSTTSEYTLIFKQFGRSLACDVEPIVDQHVLRAFEIFELPEFNDAKVQRLRGKSLYKKRDEKLLDSYRGWMKTTLDSVNSNEQAKFKNMLDKLLFIVGKRSKI